MEWEGKERMWEGRGMGEGMARESAWEKFREESVGKAREKRGKGVRKGSVHVNGR